MNKKLARCLLKDSPIIFLDEATSSLDAKNENNVLEIMLNETRKKKKTIIMITHRLHLNNYVDKVITLK